MYSKFKSMVRSFEMPFSIPHFSESNHSLSSPSTSISFWNLHPTAHSLLTLYIFTSTHSSTLTTEQFSRKINTAASNQFGRLNPFHPNF